MPANDKAKRTGVNINRQRDDRKPDVELTSPHGASIIVRAERAEALLSRPPIRMGDGSARKYVEAGEDPLVEEANSGARAPRTGDNRNTEV